MQSIEQSFWFTDLRTKSYSQLCVLKGCNYNPCTMIKNKARLSHDVVFVGIVKSDALFLIHNQDLIEFCLKRFDIGKIKWWEEEENHFDEYPIEFKKAYPTLW